MSSVLRSVRKRKKGRTLGAVDVIDREGYAELEVDAKVELIRSLIPLGLMHIEELLDEEVTALAGERYARKAPSVGGRRHGSNPGTVGLAGQRVPIRVPRIRHVTEREIPLRSYEALHGDRAVNDLLLRRVLYGISCRNDAAAAEAIPGAIGLALDLLDHLPHLLRLGARTDRQHHRQSDRRHKEISHPHNLPPPHPVVPLHHARAVPLVDLVCPPRGGESWP